MSTTPSASPKTRSFGSSPRGRSWNAGGFDFALAIVRDGTPDASGEPYQPGAWRGLIRELCAKAEAIDSPRRVVLDMDSTEVPVYGEQEQSAYNGHFESKC
jgi:Transposase DDE domain group 1